MQPLHDEDPKEKNIKARSRIYFEPIPQNKAERPQPPPTFRISQHNNQIHQDVIGDPEPSTPMRDTANIIDHQNLAPNDYNNRNYFNNNENLVGIMKTPGTIGRMKNVSFAPGFSLSSLSTTGLGPNLIDLTDTVPLSQATPKNMPSNIPSVLGVRQKLNFDSVEPQLKREPLGINKQSNANINTDTRDDQSIYNQTENTSRFAISILPAGFPGKLPRFLSKKNKILPVTSQSTTQEGETGNVRNEDNVTTKEKDSTKSSDNLKDEENKENIKSEASPASRISQEKAIELEKLLLNNYKDIQAIIERQERQNIQGNKEITAFEAENKELKKELGILTIVLQTALTEHQNAVDYAFEKEKECDSLQLKLKSQLKKNTKLMKTFEMVGFNSDGTLKEEKKPGSKFPKTSETQGGNNLIDNETNNLYQEKDQEILFLKQHAMVQENKIDELKRRIKDLEANTPVMNGNIYNGPNSQTALNMGNPTTEFQQQQQQQQPQQNGHEHRHNRHEAKKHEHNGGVTESENSLESFEHIFEAFDNFNRFYSLLTAFSRQDRKKVVEKLTQINGCLTEINLTMKDKKIHPNFEESKRVLIKASDRANLRLIHLFEIQEHHQQQEINEEIHLRFIETIVTEFVEIYTEMFAVYMHILGLLEESGETT